MKRFIFILILFLLVTTGLLTAANRKAALEEVRKPQQVTVIGERLYVTDGADIHIYGLKDFKHIESFGKAGEGPQEFKLTPFGPGLQLFPCPRGLLVNSDGRVSYFTHDGAFIEEKKVKPFSLYVPVKGGFIGNRSEADEKKRMQLHIDRYGQDFKPVKELHRTNKTVGTGLYSNLLFETIDLPYELFVYPVSGGQVFVAREGKNRELLIDIYDHQGNNIRTIRKTFGGIKVTEAYKQGILDWFKNRSPLKQFWERINDVFRFKTYFPPAKNLLVDGEYIYIITYRRKEGAHECLILDKKGNDRGRVFLSLPEEEPFAPVCYTIKDKHFYALKENPETETYELHVSKINI